MTKRTINDKNYEHVLNVWEAFKTNTMNDYHNLYLKVDVLLLACVFQTFARKSKHFLEVDPAHIYLPLVIVGMHAKVYWC